MDIKKIHTLTDEIAQVVGSNMAKVANEIGTAEGLSASFIAALDIAARVDLFLAEMSTPELASNEKTEG